jgi:pimeloyl-ACP methyl ester carboxylesterase
MAPASNPSDLPEELAYSRESEIVDGIERVTFRSAKRQNKHPLLFVHGMWHGAWCWERWQELFAMWGWDSVAFSLPGHAGSPTQRPIRWCTLGYYTDFLVREIERFETPPVIVGHSLGTALTQRYLKQVGDLPAAVMLAPWLAHSMLGLVGRYFHHDFAGGVASFLSLTANPAIRNPERAANIFLSSRATCSPEELHSKLGPESILLPLQHSRFFWKPKTETETPLLWIAAGKDKLIPPDASRESAAAFGADFFNCQGAAHDLMMEPEQALTAARIHDWLTQTLAAPSRAPKAADRRRSGNARRASGAVIPGWLRAGRSNDQPRGARLRTSGLPAT